MHLPLFHWSQVLLLSLLMLILGFLFARSIKKKYPSQFTSIDTQTSVSTPALEHLQGAFHLGKLGFEESLELAIAYRRKGDLEQAIVIHQSLYGQPGLAWQDMQRAQYELAKDFYQAGILSRAEDLLESLIVQKGQLQVTTAQLLIRLYVQQKDWLKAGDLFKLYPQTINRSTQWTFAHVLCEQAELEMPKNPDYAQQLLHLAQQRHPGSLRPNLVLLQLAQQQKRWRDWLIQLHHILKNNPQQIDLLKNNLFFVLQSQPSLEVKIIQLLKRISQEPSIRIFRAEWAFKTQKTDEAVELINNVQLNWETLLLRINYLANQLNHPELTQLDQKIQSLNLKRLKYQCLHCGYEALLHHWYCPQCERWETLQPSDVEPNQQKLL